MPFPELYSAMEQKAVDGQENPFSTIESSKFHEVQKYLSITKHKYTPLILIFSKKFWDQLSSDEKKILQDAALEAAVYQRKANRELDEKYLQSLKAAGMQINEISAPELAKIRTKTQPVVDKYSKQVGEALVKDLHRQDERQAAYELLRTAAIVPVTVIAQEIIPDGDEGEFALRLELSFSDEDSLEEDGADVAEWGALGFLFAVGVLSFADARPRGYSGAEFDPNDEFGLADFLAALKFRHGELQLD